MHVQLRSSGQHGDLVTMLVDVTSDDVNGPRQVRFKLRAGRILNMKITA
jgi:hypothetical protein